MALIGSLVWGFAQHKHLQLLQQSMADSRQQTQAVRNQPQQHDPQVRRLEETIAQLEQRLATADSTQNAAAAAPGDTAAPGVATADPDKPAEQAHPMANMAKKFQGEEGKKLAEDTADSIMAAQYNDLFTQLALPAEAEQKVRGIIRDFTVRLIHGSAEAMQHGTPESVEKFENDLRAEMKKELSRVLTNEGMAIFDEYMQTMPERMLRKGFEMQLGMFAPSLSEENRTMVLDVMVEEMMAIKEEPGNTATMGNRGAAGIEALERSRQRLSTVLDEQQMSQVDAMIQQQRIRFERLQQEMSSQDIPKTEN